MQTVLIVLLSAGIAGSGVASALWREQPGTVPAEIDLLADATSPNLNNTSAEVPPRFDPPARAEAEPMIPALPPLPAEAEPDRPKPLPPEVMLDSTTPMSTLPTTLESVQPGGSIMLRPTERLLPVMLAAFLASAPALGQAPEKGKDDVILEKLKKLQESVDAVTTNTELKLQKAASDLADLKEKVSRLTQDVEALRKAPAVPQVSGYGPNGKEMDELRKQLDRLEASLKTLREQTRTAAFPPTEGHVVLQNDYPYDMQFIVNSTAYMLRPREQYEVKLPAGAFTFRIPAVPGYQVTQSRTLGTEKPYVISVYPQ
jgi:hypothetical protein